MLLRWFLYICLCCFGVSNNNAPEAESGVVTVVLLGATGDLAKKYLWQAIFALYVNNRSPQVTFQVYAAARDDEKNGAPKVTKYINEKTTCKQDINEKISAKECESALQEFAKVWEYHQLKTEKDYQSLHERIVAKTGDRKEAGRLFYLSVPPFAYTGIAELVKKNAKAPGNAWTRVVLEKPFGEDLSSAQTMARELAEQFEEEEMFRVDHYLGKPGVMAIEEFRYSNREFDALWNNKHIERVEIVMKEMEDCEGRTGFYDAYGVIRDVHQNHLTQMTALVAMDLASFEQAANSTYVQSLKDYVLRDMRVLRAPNAVLGQYASYAKHVKADNSKVTSTRTPTWASVVAHVDNERWQGVPFIMMAGKQLDERTAYVRVIFKRTTLPAQSTETVITSPQVLFSVQGGQCDKNACVLVSKELPQPWSDGKKLPSQFSPLPSQLSAHSNGAIRQAGDAYTALLSAVFHNQRDRFVATYNLLRSWEIWTPLLKSSIEPRKYEKPLGNSLDSVLVGNTMKFVDGGKCDVNLGCSAATATKFRGQALVSGEIQSVIEVLSKDLLSKAQEAIAKHGVFHLALSGGSTPDLLFHHLAFFVPEFPWQDTHIWQVDERCVDSQSSERNYKSLSRALLQHISIPHHQVHPMPVDSECLSEDKGASRYAKELNRFTDTLDFVLLGLGDDGHTASLFPNQIESDEVFVKLAPGPKGGVKRMTLTFPLLNRASNVAVLVTGAKKHDIIRSLESFEGADPQKYPITGIKAKSLTWYLDCDALVEKSS